jgi:OHCU decarboxylase
VKLPSIAALNAAPPDAFAEAVQPLFEPAAPLARALLAERPFRSYEELIDRAEALAASLPETERIEVVNAHPRIGAAPSEVSALSYREQGYAAEAGREEAQLQRLYTELARLNAAYEARFGFRFVVFVNRRPKDAILDVLRERLNNPRHVELEAALSDLFRIARDRLGSLQKP